MSEESWNAIHDIYRMVLNDLRLEQRLENAPTTPAVDPVTQKFDVVIVHSCPNLLSGRSFAGVLAGKKTKAVTAAAATQVIDLTPKPLTLLPLLLLHSQDQNGS